MVMAVECVAEYLSSIDSLRINVFFSQSASASPPEPQSLPLLSVKEEEEVEDYVDDADVAACGGAGKGALDDCEVTEKTRNNLVLRVGTQANEGHYGRCKLGLPLAQHQILPRDGYVELKGRVRRRRTGNNSESSHSAPMLSTDLVDQRLLYEEQSLRKLLEKLRKRTGGEGRYDRQGGPIRDAGTLRCAKCNAVLSRFSRVERLPHSSWVESAAQWFCACSGTENALHYLEQVEDRLQPTAGNCLLGETVCIVGAEDIFLGLPFEQGRRFETNVESKGEGEGEREMGRIVRKLTLTPGAFRCHGCKREVGIFGPWQSTHGASKGSQDEAYHALTLFKYAVQVGGGGGDGGDREDCFRVYTPCTSFAQDLQMACQSNQQMKYQVSVLGDGNGNRNDDEKDDKGHVGVVRIVQLVILNQKVMLGHVHLDRESKKSNKQKAKDSHCKTEWSGLSMKVLHKTMTIEGEEGEEGKHALQACDRWAKTETASCITVPWDVGLDLIQQLESSTTKLLPKSCSSYDDFSIGYLKLIQPSNHPLFPFSQM